MDESVDESSSRRRALELMHDFDRSDSRTSLGAVNWYFFGDPANRNHVSNWAKHGQPLPRKLVNILWGYVTSLTVMQRLEARHHLVSMAVSRGRALSVPGVVSGLRRRFNGDVHQASFRSDFPQLLNSFDQLLPQQWSSKKQLLEMVYGFGLDQLHPTTVWEEQQLQRPADQTNQPPVLQASRAVTCQILHIFVFSQGKLSILPQWASYHIIHNCIN